jgi:hypothetical protein
MTTVHINPTDVPHIIRATFPGYTGKKVEVRASESVTISNLNWGGGSRSQYAACTLDGEPTGNAFAANQADPWKNKVEGQSVAVPPGHALVEHCLFCGKDLGLRIYVNPADMPRYLPAGNAELTREETVVLAAIRTWISAYRREGAAKLGVNRSAYEETVAALKAKGLLSANGGLSLKGKNVAGGLPSADRM